MIESVFLHEFKQHGSVKIGDWILWKKSLNLWNMETDEVINFKTLAEAFEFKIDGKTIKEIIAGADMSLFKMILNGGNGASGPQYSFNFDHARGGNGGDHPDQNPDGTRRVPAQLNTRIKVKTEKEAIQQFRNTHVNDKYESGATLTADGFVTSYVAGDSTSVGIWGGKGEFVIHNHPAGSDGKGNHFSDSDLILTARDKSRGIAAIAPEGNYLFYKGTHFKGEQFARAVKNANLRGKDYNDAADKWLKKNQKKYGYTYKFEKNKDFGKSTTKTKTTNAASTKATAPKAKVVANTPAIKWGADGQGSLF